MRIGYTSALSAAFLMLAFSRAPAQTPDPLDAPPPNLATTTVHLSAILAQHDAAVGRPSGADTVIEDWRFTDSGVSGTLHLERSGTNYHSRIVTGSLIEEYGQQNGHRWHRDYDGFVSPTTTIDDKTFFSQQVYEDAADPKNDASVAGVTTGSDPSYVVRVLVSQTRHPEWIFYNVASGLITRVEWILGKRRIARTFSDFRTTGGVTSPWHVHDDWDPSALDDDYYCTSMQAGVAIDPSQFAPPASTPQTSYSTVGFRIPARMYDDGTIIMRMNVNGRGLDMMLDTAANEDIIDEDVAKQMGLPTFGHVDHLSDGEVPFETLIPDATVGPLALHNLAFDAMPFTFQWSYNIDVVGVLGFDFLSTNVLKIDYQAATVEVLPAASFDGPDPVPGAISYSLDFDDGFPFISLGIDDVSVDDVLVANEIYSTHFFGDLFAAHPELSIGQNGKATQTEDLPFADNGSFGQQVTNWFAKPTSVHFGSVNFEQPLIRATNMPLDLSSARTVDVALGFDFLRFFDVYIDYPHGRILVKPNALLIRASQHG